MSYLDKSTLIANVEALRSELGLSQTEFADRIGTSQPNYNRAINPNSSQSLTVEQLYNIAREFNVSIDSLLGIKQKHTDRDICSLFTSLLEERKLVKVDFSREEWVYTPFDIDGYPDCHKEQKMIHYPAFIFPNNKDHGPNEIYTEMELSDLESDALCNGTADESNQQINAYFDKFLSLYEIHLAKKIPDDAYQRVVEEFLNNLK